MDDLRLFCGRFRIHAFHGKTFHRALFYTGTALHTGIGIDNPLPVLPVNPYRSRRARPFTGTAENTLFPLIDNVSAVDRERRPRLQRIRRCHRRFEKIGNYPFHKGHIAHNALLSFTTTDTGIDGQDNIRHICQVTALKHLYECRQIGICRCPQTEPFQEFGSVSFYIVKRFSSRLFHTDKAFSFRRHAPHFHVNRPVRDIIDTALNNLNRPENFSQPYSCPSVSITGWK